MLNSSHLQKCELSLEAMLHNTAELNEREEGKKRERKGRNRRGARARAKSESKNTRDPNASADLRTMRSSSL